MASTERGKGFFRRIAGAVKEIFRDHTPEDEERVRRIAGGEITPEDKEWYLYLRWRQLAAVGLRLSL